MSTVATPTRRSRWRLFLEICAGAAVVWLIALTMLAGEVFFLDRDAGKLRREIVRALDVSADRQVQVAVGPGVLSATRTLLHFIPEAPAEAADALGGVVHASVGVYQLRAGEHPFDARAVFEAADRALQPRGWTRVVGVHQTGKLVVLYAPTETDLTDQPEICLAVIDGRQLVIVQGQIDGPKLAGLASHLQPGFALR